MARFQPKINRDAQTLPDIAKNNALIFNGSLADNTTIKCDRNGEYRVVVKNPLTISVDGIGINVQAPLYISPNGIGIDTTGLGGAGKTGLGFTLAGDGTRISVTGTTSKTVSHIGGTTATLNTSAVTITNNTYDWTIASVPTTSTFGSQGHLDASTPGSSVSTSSYKLPAPGAEYTVLESRGGHWQADFVRLH